MQNGAVISIETTVNDVHARTGVHVRQYPVNELTEDLPRSLHRLLVLRRATAASDNTGRGVDMLLKLAIN